MYGRGKFFQVTAISKFKFLVVAEIQLKFYQAGQFQQLRAQFFQFAAKMTF